MHKKSEVILKKLSLFTKIDDFPLERKISRKNGGLPASSPIVASRQYMLLGKVPPKGVHHRKSHVSMDTFRSIAFGSVFS